MDDDSEHHGEEDGFSRDGPYLPGLGAAWRVALEEPWVWARKVGRSRAGGKAGHPFLCKAWGGGGGGRLARPRAARLGLGGAVGRRVES